MRLKTPWPKAGVLLAVLIATSTIAVTTSRVGLGQISRPRINPAPRVCIAPGKDLVFRVSCTPGDGRCSLEACIMDTGTSSELQCWRYGSDPSHAEANLGSPVTVGVRGVMDKSCSCSLQIVADPLMDAQWGHATIMPPPKLPPPDPPKPERPKP